MRNNCGKNKKKTIIALMILSVFLVTSLYETDPVYAAGKNGIKFTNINSNFVLKKGKKYKIRYVKSGKAAKRKVVFKSSNNRIATVSKRGVIKGKKKGKVRITAYVIIKGKKRYKKSVWIKVGTRVKGIRIKGYDSVRVGDTVTLTRSVSPSSASNNKVTWRSSDKTIAKVSSTGKVKGLKEGDVIITAKAKDGSGVKTIYRMHVYRFRNTDTNWVAHRGLHTKAEENTKEAFVAAGKAGGFWGCECDIHETKHVETDTDDPENGSFELVLNHDNTYERVYGIDKKVADMTADEVRADPILSGNVCFFEEYLEVCRDYGMVPVVEFKMRDSDRGEELTPEAVKKAVDSAYKIGEQEFLESIDWISFYSGTLETLHEYLADEYEVDRPMITYLISAANTPKSVKEKVDLAKDNGFTNVAIHKSLLTMEVVNKCRKEGLALGAWTYADTLKDRYSLHKDMMRYGQDLENMTVDYRPWSL